MRVLKQWMIIMNTPDDLKHSFNITLLVLLDHIIRPYKVNDLFYIYNKSVNMCQWKKVKFCVSNILSVVATGTNAVLRLE